MSKSGFEPDESKSMSPLAVSPGPSLITTRQTRMTYGSVFQTLLVEAEIAPEMKCIQDTRHPAIDTPGRLLGIRTPIRMGPQLACAEGN